MAVEATIFYRYTSETSFLKLMYARIVSGIWCAIFITLHYVHINNHQWTIANKCVQTNCWTSSLSFSSSLKWTHVDRRHTVEEAVTMKWNATEAVILRNSAQRQSHFLWKIHYFSLSLCVHCFHSVERKEKIMRRKKIIAFKESHNFFFSIRSNDTTMRNAAKWNCNKAEREYTQKDSNL